LSVEKGYVVDLESLRAYLLAKEGSVEEQPFGPDALVFKVKDKMFALIAWREDPLSITLKCDPEEAQVLRRMYAAVQPGYHMNKRHWNTVTLDGSVPADEVHYMIDSSYALVASLSRQNGADLRRPG
jgi:predicted DNA-binding protein (MmcQ/YjbR family)